jgi:hypothetical protein
MLEAKWILSVSSAMDATLVVKVDSEGRARLSGRMAAAPAFRVTAAEGFLADNWRRWVDNIEDLGNLFFAIVVEDGGGMRTG